MRQVVVMPGGFHPFHAGHAALYKSAVEAFNDADVYVAATNDTKTRPFPFSIKEKLAKLAGVADKHFVQVKSPFQAKEITQHYNPDEDVLIFVRSEKDKTEQPKPGGTKKDGSPAYFQPWTGKNLQPFSKHAYIAYLPTVEFGPGITSATEIRNAWPTLNDKRKTAMVMSLYPVTQKNPKLAANVVKMLDVGMGNELAEELRPNIGQAMNIHRQTAQKINPNASKFVWKRPNQINGSYTENELKSLSFKYSTKYNMWGGTQQMWDRLTNNINEFAPPSSDRGDGGDSRSRRIRKLLEIAIQVAKEKNVDELGMIHAMNMIAGDEFFNTAVEGILPDITDKEYMFVLQSAYKTVKQGLAEGDVVSFKQPSKTLTWDQVPKDVLLLANDWFWASEDNSGLDATIDPEGFGNGTANDVKYLTAKLQQKGWTIDFNDEYDGPGEFNLRLTNKRGQNVLLSIEDAQTFTGWAKGTSQYDLDEGASLSVEQLAHISDKALDDAYHYGRSTPGANFGWMANMQSAKAAKRLIDAGVTDIEAISDAIHKGWNVTAAADYKGQLQLDTPTPDEKKLKRAKLAMQSYSQLPEDEKEKDRVVARALLQAIKGNEVTEGLGIPYPTTYEQENNKFKRRGPMRITAMTEFAPPGSDDREPDEEEILRQLAAQWWNGTEQQMKKAQQTLQAMGWEIGQDESGDDDAGVFVIRIGDENGDSYIAFNHSDLDLNEDYLNEK